MIQLTLFSYIIDTQIRRLYMSYSKSSSAVLSMLFWEIMIHIISMLLLQNPTFCAGKLTLHSQGSRCAACFGGITCESIQLVYSSPTNCLGFQLIRGPLSRNYDHVASLWEQEGWIPQSAVELARAHYSAYMVKRKDGLRIISLNTDMCESSFPSPFLYLSS